MTAADLLTCSPYEAYGYSYPHKSAYRPLPEMRRLREVWAGECKGSLFLYLHVPFCEVRCGFCNLFTTAQAGHLCDAYISALQRQAQAVREELGDVNFARCAVGGGTPTFLSPDQLRRLLIVIRDTMGARPEAIPTSVELSPATATREKLAVLSEFGVDRVSLGVQVFDEAETRALGRPQKRDDVYRALDLIRAAGFATLNIDLIYGGDGQTVESWLGTLAEALRYAPEELYLYPLYIRPLTGLGLRGRAWDDQRLAAYRAGRDFLRVRGYRQVSMRMFRSESASGHDGPVYCCQMDGMVGLGCGARSYTRSLHYSGRYAIGRSKVLSIIETYIRSPAARFRSADYGFEFDDEERRRRFVIKSLLRCGGLDRSAYERAFRTDCLTDVPELRGLETIGLVERDGRCIQLTDAGLERSDAIAPSLYSKRVRALMESYVSR